MLVGVVPWPFAVPAPGASKDTKVCAASGATQHNTAIVSERSFEDGEKRALQQRGVGVIGVSPLCKGEEDASLSPVDHAVTMQEIAQMVGEGQPALRSSSAASGSASPSPQSKDSARAVVSIGSSSGVSSATDAPSSANLHAEI